MATTRNLKRKFGGSQCPPPPQARRPQLSRAWLQHVTSNVSLGDRSAHPTRKHAAPALTSEATSRSLKRKFGASRSTHRTRKHADRAAWLQLYLWRIVATSLCRGAAAPTAPASTPSAIKQHQHPNWNSSVPPNLRGKIFAGQAAFSFNPGITIPA